MTEYSTVVTSIELKPELKQTNVDQFNVELTTLLNQIVQTTAKACRDIEGGNWHILSHQLTLLGDRLVVSFLLRR